MEKILDTDFQELYLLAQSQIQQIELSQYYQYALYLFASFALYWIGKKRGQSEILISKRTKLEISQYKDKTEQREKQKFDLLKESKNLSFIIKCLVFVVIMINVTLYYLDMFDSEWRWFIFGMSCLLVFLFFFYSNLEKKKLAKIKASLEISKREIDQKIVSIGQLLGDEILGLMKQQLFKQESEDLRRKMIIERDNMRMNVEYDNRKTIDELKQKIKSLEDKEFQQKQEIHNFKARSTQQHKTEPISNTKDTEINKLLTKITYLEKESQIQKNMISKVINIEWCPDCINLENHCINNYLEQAKKIGIEYQAALNELFADDSKSKQAIVQQKE